MIYFDNSATTKPDAQVLESFCIVTKNYYGNASSQHQMGYDASKLLNKAKEHAATLLGASVEEVIFTNGGTEANNLAIKGIAFRYQNYGKHIVTTKLEHPAVLEPFKALEQFGFEVTYLDQLEQGVVTVDQIKRAVRGDTILVSVMHVNNEIGTISPIQGIGTYLKSKKHTYFHVDDVQGFGKVPLHLFDASIDLLSISGHKFHGLKGTGLLFKNKCVDLFPLVHGGGQQNKLHAGTENIAGIVSLVKAMRKIKEKQATQPDYLVTLTEKLRAHLSEMKEVVINTPKEAKSHILNFSLPGYLPEVVVHALEKEEVFISTKSACASKSKAKSAVLHAMGKNQAVSQSSLRVSFSYDNTAAEIETFISILKKVIVNLKTVMG